MDGTVNLAGLLADRVKSCRKRVVVIGDAIEDVWVSGHQENCQDGCQKFVQVGVTARRDGGAANASECLSKWDIEIEGIYLQPLDRPVKTRFVDKNGIIVFRWDDETRADPKPYMYRTAMEWVGCADGVLLSDYDKGLLTLEFIRLVSGMCVKGGIPCVADCKRQPEFYPGCILKGNRDYTRKYGGLAVITYGEGVPEVQGEFLDMVFPPVDCINHVGAGDCFAAHLTLALAYGFSLKEAAAIAHSAGRVYVQHLHNRPPLPSEIVADMATAHFDTISTSMP